MAHCLFCDAIAVMVFNGNTNYPSRTVIKKNLAYSPFSTGPVFFSNG